LTANKAVLAILLIIPIVINLAVILYNVAAPAVLGLPFFWWFQIVMLPVSALFYIAFAFLAGEEV
jgi:hypothetical protein